MNTSAEKQSPLGFLLRMFVSAVIGYLVIVATFAVVITLLVRYDGAVSTFGVVKLSTVSAKQFIDYSLGTALARDRVTDQLLLESMGNMVRMHSSQPIVYGTLALAFLIVGLLAACFRLAYASILLPPILWYFTAGVINAPLLLSARPYNFALVAFIQIAAVVLGVLLARWQGMGKQA